MLCYPLLLPQKLTDIGGQITINIGNEVRDSTKLLSGMNDTFDETGGFLGGTMKKMNKMARKQGGQWCLCESSSLALWPVSAREV